MKVKELIKQLNEIEDKNMEVLLETEDIDVLYKPTSVVERRDFVEVCTCFETVKD